VSESLTSKPRFRLEYWGNTAEQRCALVAARPVGQRQRATHSTLQISFLAGAHLDRLIIRIAYRLFMTS
jgi:hypothetical protein